MRPLFCALGAPGSSRRRVSTTVTNSPRTVHTPTTSGGERGTRVMLRTPRISSTCVSGTPYASPPTAKVRISRTGSSAPLIRAGTAVDGSMPSPSDTDAPSSLARVARAGLLDQCAGIEHQRDALVCQLRGAGEAAHRVERTPERADDDVLLAL